jgi:hypothetical protein
MRYTQKRSVLFFLFKTFAPLLAGKEIIIQTDHQNLLWMQNNQTPIVQRWRTYAGFHA